MFGDSSVADSSDGTLIGTTPVRQYITARGDYRVVVRAPGYDPARRIASRFLTPSEGLRAADRSIALDVRLSRTGSVPDGMVAIPGGPYQIVGHDIGRGQAADLAPFALDRFEVSNDRFAEFVRAGGYRNAALWSVGGETVTPARFVDKTGLPAPRDWVNGAPPAGRGSHPVTGVSWHEAAAYCTWRGGRLPSLFEWEKASRDGRVSRFGILMPWGQYDAKSLGAVRANLSGNDTAPVESYPVRDQSVRRLQHGGQCEGVARQSRGRRLGNDRRLLAGPDVSGQPGREPIGWFAGTSASAACDRSRRARAMRVWRRCPSRPSHPSIIRSVRQSTRDCSSTTDTTLAPPIRGVEPSSRLPTGFASGSGSTGRRAIPSCCTCSSRRTPSRRTRRS